MTLTIILISIATFIATLLGGLFAIKLKDKLHLVLGFSAGAVIAVAFFDLIPESLELGKGFYDNATILTVTAVGFMVYLLLDRFISLHFHAHDDAHDDAHDNVGLNDYDYDHDNISASMPDGIHLNEHPHTHDHDHGGNHQRGFLGATSLCFHSFLDGIAIGLAFQVSSSVGAIVTVAVLTHDFSDGINTVGLILRNAGEKRQALKWLIADAVAPVFGAMSTLFFTVPEQWLGIIIAIFAGFFLYIGASDLIPESHHAHPKILTTLMTIVGAGVLYLAIRLAGV
jgi:zinc transporter ZupT